MFGVLRLGLGTVKVFTLKFFKRYKCVFMANSAKEASSNCMNSCASR